MVDRDLFDEYERGLTGNAEFVADAVRTLVAMLDGVPEEAVPSELERGCIALVKVYGSIASTIAVEFYRALRSMSEVPVPYEPTVFPADDGNLLPYDVAQALERSGGDLGKLASALADVSQQRVMEHADQTLISNARRDPAHPKWALVPHVGACDWCKMLGSRGFEYRSETTVRSARHPNCLCTPVIDFSDDPSLDGYDVEGLRDYYRDNLQAKWSGRRRKGGGGSHAKRKPLPGFESTEKISDYMRAADSVEELTKRQATALDALDALHGHKKSLYDVQLANVRNVAQKRYEQLLKSK